MEEKTKPQEVVQENHVGKNNASNVWEDLSNKYDVKNATFDDIVDIANSLYEAGEISLKEVALMTFDYERATNDLKQRFGGASSDFSMFVTEANENGKRNWIEEFKERANKQFGFGNLIGHSNNLNIYNILQKLDN